MNRGLILRALRESWPATLALGLVLALLELALAYILPGFGAKMSQEWLQIDFVRSILQTMLGTEIGGRLGLPVFHAMAWIHPVVLALISAHAMLQCTRVPTGEVDRGTVDVLLGLPVSRWEVFVSETFVWLLLGILLMTAAAVGNELGTLGLPLANRPEPMHVLAVLINLFCLYLTVGGLTCLIASVSDRRGAAITAVFLILVALVLLDYLAQFWAPLEKIAFVSPLHYHRPILVLQSGLWPWKNCAVLTIVGAGLWYAGGVVFSRRDLCTV
jgi:ABC-type transport system involved in multi-copper enzyme maturation permease subunit